MSILGQMEKPPMQDQMPAEQMPQEPMPEEMPQDGMAQDGMEEVEASPEEQAIVDQYVSGALKQAMSNQSLHSSMVGSMRAAAKTNLNQGIAQTAVMLYDKAEEDVGLLPDEALQEPIFESIIENLMAVAMENTLAPAKAFNEDMAVEIYTMAARLWMDAHPERANPEDQAYVDEMEAQGQPERPPQEQAPQEQAPQPQQPSNILGMQ